MTETVQTSSGEVELFHNSEPDPRDPYLQEAGWCARLIDFDEPPIIVGKDIETARQAAMADFGPPAVPGV
jgi:hypothetical protein